MRELIARAAQMGLEVHASHLPGDTVGLYVPSLGRIYFDIRLTPSERRSVIAHELGHAHYGHDCDSPSNERQAEAYAATLLVDPEWYAELERVTPHAADIADEMCVTVEVIEDYRRYCLQRIGDVTYTRARMGGRQWAYRAASV